jgi:hypothetical protein
LEFKKSPQNETKLLIFILKHHLLLHFKINRIKKFFENE